MRLKALLLATISLAASSAAAQNIDAQIRDYWIKYKETPVRAVERQLPLNNSSTYLENHFRNASDDVAANIFKRYYGLDNHTRIEYLTADLLETTQKYHAIRRNHQRGTQNSIRERQAYQEELSELRARNQELERRVSGDEQPIYVENPLNTQMREENAHLREQLTKNQQATRELTRRLEAHKDSLQARHTQAQYANTDLKAMHAMLQTQQDSLHATTQRLHAYRDSLQHQPPMTLPEAKLLMRLQHRTYTFENIRLLCESRDQPRSTCIDVTDVIYDHYNNHRQTQGIRTTTQ